MWNRCPRDERLLVVERRSPGADAGPGDSAATDGPTPSDTGAQPDAQHASDAQSHDAPPADAPSDASTTLPTITGFTALGQGPGGKVLCDPDGTCFFSYTGGSVSKVPPNGTSATAVKLSNNSLVGSTSGLALDGQGTVFTCLTPPAGAGGVFQLTAGATQWTPLGTGLSIMNACSDTLVRDTTGAMFVGNNLNDTQIWKLPSGQTAWANTGSGLTQGFYATATWNGDVYTAGIDGVFVLKSGGSAFTKLAGSPIQVIHLAVDSAGNLYASGGGASGVHKMASGGTTWTPTTGITSGATSANLVIDGNDDAFIVADGPTYTNDAGYSVIPQTLYKLAAGTLAWTKVVDVAGILSQEKCDERGGLASDHHGHLVLMCTSTLLRSQP